MTTGKRCNGKALDKGETEKALGKVRTRENIGPGRISAELRPELCRYHWARPGTEEQEEVEEHWEQQGN